MSQKRRSIGSQFAFGVVLFGGISFAEINLSPNTANIAAAEGSGSVQVINTNSSSWNAVSSQSWLTITSGVSGNGNGTIQYVVAGNPAATNRVATVTVTPSGSAAKALVVTQLGGELSVSPSSANVQGSGGNGILSVNSSDPSLRWTASSNQSWLTINSVSTVSQASSINIANNGSTVYFQENPQNSGPVVRTLGQTFTVPTDNVLTDFSLNPQVVASFDYRAYLFQWDPVGLKATGPALFTSAVLNGSQPASFSGLRLALTPGVNYVVLLTTQGVVNGGEYSDGLLFNNSNDVYAGGGAYQQTSFASGGSTGVGSWTTTAWTALNSDFQFTAHFVESNTGPGSTFGPGSITWTAQANPTDQSRTATITVVPLNGTARTFTVGQQGGTPTGSISVNTSSLNLDAAGASGSLQIAVTTQSITWNAASNQPWLTIASGSGTGNGSFQYLALANPAATSRTATITVAGSQGPTRSLTATQTGGTLTVNPLSASVGAEGGGGSISLTTTDTALVWQAVSSQPWLTFSNASGTGAATLQWTTQSNLSTQGRAAQITITPSGGAAQAFYLSQQGITDGNFTLAPATATVSAAASSGSLQINSTVPSLTWVAASSQTWLHISSGSSGTGSGLLRYSADGTNTAAVRTGVITVTPAVGNPVLSTITQTGAVLTINPSAANPLGAGGTGSVSIATNNTSLNWTATSSDPWLTITSALAGSGDATLQWAAQANATASARTATLRITPSGGTDVNFSVTQAALTGTLISSVPSLTFSYQQLGTLPADSQVVITSVPSGLPFTASASTVSGGNWLRVTGTGPAPGVLSISADPTNLAVGSYQGTITVTSPTATNSPLTIPVTLGVAPKPVLVGRPNELTFYFQQNGPTPAPQPITLSTSSGLLDYVLVPDLDAPWLSVTGLGPAPATLIATVSPGSLAVGAYSGRVILQSASAGNSPFSIPVSLRVSPAPSLVPAPTSLSLTMREFDPPPAAISLGVGSSGINLPFTVTTTATWLKVTGGGTTPATLQVSADPTGMRTGTYQASLVLSSNLAANSPQLVPVVLTILPAHAISADPERLSFSLTQGGNILLRQGPIGGATATIAVSGDIPVPFTTTVQTSSGGNWLSAISPVANTPGLVQVTAAVGNLLPGQYEGSVTLTSNSVVNSPLVIPVLLTVSVRPQLTIAPNQLSFAHQLLSGATIPGQTLLVSVPDSTVVTASATSSSGNWLSVSPGGTTPTAIQVSANAQGLTPGVYSGTVILASPGYASASTPVTLTVTEAPLISVYPSAAQFSFQQGGSLPSPQSLSVGSNSTPLHFSSFSGTAPWLSVNGGGTTKGNVSLSVNPTSLPAGTYRATVVVSSQQAGNSPVAVPVTLNVTQGPPIQTQPSSLSFDYTQRRALPATQSVGISSSQTLSFNTSIAGSQSWLAVRGGNRTDASLDVSVNPSGLEPGRYTTSILINAPAAENNPVELPVVLTVHAAPRIRPSLDELIFSYQIGSPVPSNQLLVMDSSDPLLLVTGTVTNESGESWLSLSGAGNVPTAFSFGVNPAGLQAGIHHAAVTFASPGAENSPLSIPVTLLIAAAPVLRASPSRLQVSYEAGGSIPTIAPIQVTSSGTPLSFQATASTDSDGSWLSVSNGSTTPALVTVNLDPTGLAPGTYTGAITFQSPGSGNTLTVPIALTISTSITLSGSPNSLYFSAQQNGPQPAAQTVQINSGSAAISFSYSKSPGANWLSLAGDTTTPGGLLATVSTAGLSPGTYSAVILVQSILAANSPLQIPISLEVTAAPVLQTSPAVLQFSYTIAGASPVSQSFHVSSSGTPLSYSALVLPGIPWLFSTGSGTTPDNVAVSVDPGALSPGTYEGTVLVSSPSAESIAPVHIILTVSAAPTLTITPSQLNFAYQTGGPLPVAQTLIARSDPKSVFVSPPAVTSFGSSPWITISGGGSTPAPFAVGVDPTGLSPGVYRQEISIGSSEVPSGPVIVPVTLTVTSGAILISQPNVLAFTGELGFPSPPNRQIVVSTSDGTAIPISAQPSFGISWLTVSSDASTTPATFTVATNPAGLPVGDYFGSIILSSPTPGVGPQVVQVALRITTRPSLIVSPAAVSFSAAPFATPPAPISVAVNTGAVSVTFSGAPGPGTPWLSVSGGGTTPSSINIAINQAGLAPGSYHGTVFLTAAGAGNSPLGIPVDLLVSDAALIAASPSSLSFAASVSPRAQPSTLTVSTTVPGLSVSASASAQTPWLKVNGGGSSPQNIFVTVDPTGMSPGTYQGAVQLAADTTANSPLLVPVSLVLTATPSLQATPAGLEFHYDSSGSLPAAQTVALNLGGLSAGSAQATVAPGTPWLSVGSTASDGSILVSVNPSGLLAGNYTGSIQVTAPGASNSPLTISVHFSVTGIPTLDLSQDAIAFAALVSQQPVSTVLTIGGGITPIDLQFDVTGSTWLSVTPLRGNTPLNATVTANPAELRAGNYAGSIRISSGGTTLKTVPVNFTVAPDYSLGVSPRLLSFKYSNGGAVPAPAKLYLGVTSPFTIQASASDSWISVDPVNPTPSGPVRVTVNPAALVAGIYHGTVTFSTLDGATGAFLVLQKVPVELFVDQPAAPRILSVANGMSFLNTPLAPGLIFSIFGTGLGPSTPENAHTEFNSFPHTLAGVQVFVSGILCPIMYVSDTQINAIAPYALYTKDAATVVVQRNGVLSDELPMPVAPSSPGLFSAAKNGVGQGAILNQDQRANSRENPATRGSIITLLGGGAGQTNPQGIEGMQEYGTPPPTALLPVSVFIGGIPALDITYAGMASTQAGVFQVNVRIPDNAPSNEVPVLVQIGSTTQQLLTVSIYNQGVRRSRQE